MFIQDDGGRAAAGFKGRTDDCVCRAVAIATGRPYREVYEQIRALTGRSPRNRIPNRAVRTLMDRLGFAWTPTMGIGSGCAVHLRPDELPKGVVIVSLSRHVCAVKDGVAHDTCDPSRGGTRCVYGYWTPKEARP